MKSGNPTPAGTRLEPVDSRHHQAALLTRLPLTRTGDVARPDQTEDGEAESKLRFPVLHTLDGDEISTKLVLSFRLLRVDDYAA
jgi:hypothetical protein